MSGGRLNVSETPPQDTPIQAKRAIDGKMPVDAWHKHGQRLVGCWRCVKVEMFDTTGPDRRLPVKPHGEVPMGRLMISSRGYMSVLAVNPYVLGALQKHDNASEATDEEIAAYAREQTMYCGLLELLQEDDGQLTWQTKVEISADAKSIGCVQARWCRFEQLNGKMRLVLQSKESITLVSPAECRTTRNR